MPNVNPSFRKRLVNSIHYLFDSEYNYCVFKVCPICGSFKLKIDSTFDNDDGTQDSIILCTQCNTRFGDKEILL